MDVSSDFFFGNDALTFDDALFLPSDGLRFVSPQHQPKGRAVRRPGRRTAVIATLGPERTDLIRWT